MIKTKKHRSAHLFIWHQLEIIIFSQKHFAFSGRGVGVFMIKVLVKEGQIIACRFLCLSISAAIRRKCQIQELWHRNTFPIYLPNFSGRKLSAC